MRLSIIIPCYNAEPYISELLDCLDKQMRDDVEVIVIDDGSRVPFDTSYKWVKTLRQANGGASKARNTGLDNATGDYVAFIDADDLVSDKYIDTILAKIEEGFDYLYMSWKTLPGGWACDVKLNSIDDTFPSFNLCVWNRVYKRSKIGKIRFNTKKKIAEDAQFIREVKETGKKAFIGDYMYFYRSNTPDSLTKRFGAGKVETRRVVYNIPHVKKDPDLLAEVRRLDKEAEVIIMTTKCEMPELSKYAMVISPTVIKGTELRGEPTGLFTLIDESINADICIWTSITQKIGGIETWIYNFCAAMSKHYDIVVMYDEMDDMQINRIIPYARVIRRNKPVVCKTLIVNRITDKTPSTVTYERKIQMCHACKMIDAWEIPNDNDLVVGVSQVVLDSFNREGEVIHNLINIPKDENVLLLVSATRLGTFEKGKKRMIALAEQMRDAGIRFVWLCFSEVDPECDLITWMRPRLDITAYIRKADYLVQLSDEEGFGFSIFEALVMGTPVITTPISILEEMRFKDGEHGYIVPFDGDMDVKRFRWIPEVDYRYDNASIIRKWRKILGEGNPTYKPSIKNMQILTTFKDSATGRTYKQGNTVYMLKEIAEKAKNAGYAREV